MERVLPDGIEKILLTKQQISDRVAELGAEITRDYAGRTPLLIGVLKGAVVFMSDLAREIELSCRFDFVSASSYKNSAVSLGNVEYSAPENIPFEGGDVILVEDILDTGRTLRYIINSVLTRKPNSLKLCVLLDKPSRRIPEAKGLAADYTGFTIPDNFVVGYGLDYAERYRNLPYIAQARV